MTSNDKQAWPWTWANIPLCLTSQMSPIDGTYGAVSKMVIAKNNLEVGSLDAIYWDPPDQLNFTIGPILGLLCMSHLRHPCAYRTS